MEKAIVLDIDGTAKRKNLTALLLHTLVEKNRLPYAEWRDLERLRTEYEHRRIPWAEYDKLLIHAFEERKCLKGLEEVDVRTIAQTAVYSEAGKVHLFTDQLMKAGRECGYLIVFISGSPVEIVEPFAKHHEVPIWHGTTFEVVDGVYTGTSTNYTVSKDVILRRIAQEHGINLEASVAVGDSPRDVPMFDAVEFPIMFNPNPELYELNKLRPWHLSAIVEERMIYGFHFHGPKRYEYGYLRDMLPADLTENLYQRLNKLGVLA